MIQRPQTIYLLLAALCAFGLFMAPFVQTGTEIADSALFADSQYTIQDNSLLLIFFSIAGAAAILAIGLFNKHGLQKNIVYIGMMINLIASVLVIVFLMGDTAIKAGAETGIGLGLILAILYFVFGFLSAKGISKDQKEIRALNSGSIR